ncbi:skin secretory protein xP2-like [Ovis aries]|uniref:skin secretory protein xP2-like n=1 Tax=Ovis aries TaxID=9940 RepID=UPI001C2EB2FF|nr:skin secretory protein xP2-like [Ovis aries]
MQASRSYSSIIQNSGERIAPAQKASGSPVSPAAQPWLLVHGQECPPGGTAASELWCLPVLDRASGAEGVGLGASSAGPGPGAARPTAPAPRGSRADLPAPRHLTVSAPPSIPSRDPAPEGAPPSRPLGPGLAPGPLAGAQARPSCTWAAPARGATPRSAEITFPGAAAAWRAPGHTPPARRPRSRPGRRLLRSPVSRPPASPSLLEERHPAARAGGSGRESFKLATRDELGDPQAAAVPRDDLTSTRRSRAARGAAAPPPSEEPEPQDARGLAAALRAQFRRRFPGRSRALTRSRASPPSLPCVRAAPDPAGDWCSRRRRGAGSPFMPRV